MNPEKIQARKTCRMSQRRHLFSISFSFTSPFFGPNKITRIYMQNCYAVFKVRILNTEFQIGTSLMEYFT